jgi:hypothetical protein
VTKATEGTESTEQEDASIWFSVFSVPCGGFCHNVCWSDLDD